MGKSRAELDDDRLIQLGLTRLVEILGEAATRVPREVQDRLPALPWREMVSVRNRLIHGYDMVDLDILWEIVTTDLPALVAELERALGSPSSGDGSA